MAPSVGGFITGIGREIRRDGLRVRNGGKYLTGGEWAPVDPTPSDVVWQRGKTQLRRYRSERRVRRSPPVIAFLGLVSRAHILDLTKGNSFVDRLLRAGHDVFVLDWGEPDESDAGNSLATYVGGYLPDAIEAVLDETAAADVSLIGYCMGGNFALLALAANPDLPVGRLVTMAVPLDFRQMGPLIDALSDGCIDVEAIIDETGNVPAALIQGFFKIRKPTADLAQRANVLQHLWNDEYMRGHQAMARWVREQVPMPGQAVREIVDNWIRDNAFRNDALRLGTRQLRLNGIRVPTLALIATRDHIVPHAAATPIASVLSGTSVDVLQIDAGHASLASGRTADNLTVPKIIEWLSAHTRRDGRRP